MSGSFDSAADRSRRFNNACYAGDAREAQELLADGADPSWTGESGKNALHFASMGGHAGICEFLAANHPQCLGARDHAGMTPLHLACRNSKRDAAIALRKAGADLDARDDFGRKPLEICFDSALRSELTLVDATLRLGEEALSDPAAHSFLRGAFF